MQKWEYKTIIRTRGWNKDGGAKPFDIDIDATLAELGEAGWELSKWKKVL
jgi:hypothetical protein